MLNIEEIRKYPENQNWIHISYDQKLSEDFIREFQDRVNWTTISEFQKLSEDFIREFQDKVNWNYISYSQKLSEDFIREFQDKVNWIYIVIYQKLSEEFIREFQDKVNWIYIVIYQKLSKEIMEEFNLVIPKNSWMYWVIERKKKYVQKNHPYEIVDNKIVAYKSTRDEGYSVYNFQYHYEVGKEYECHADYNSDNTASFGLSAWTKEGALSYYSYGKLFKVEIDLEDLACITKDGKIRASKIKILEEIPKEDWYK